MLILNKIENNFVWVCNSPHKHTALEMQGHRSTRVENPGGVLEVFVKIPGGGGGGQGFQEKLPGGSPYFGFYFIFIDNFFENLPGRVLFHTPLPLTPLCASMCKVFEVLTNFR
jgi:hypothetical protein